MGVLDQNAILLWNKGWIEDKDKKRLFHELQLTFEVRERERIADGCGALGPHGLQSDSISALHADSCQISLSPVMIPKLALVNELKGAAGTSGH